MITSLMDNISKCAVRGLTDKTGNPVDYEIAYKMIDIFLKAYRKVNNDSYHGEVYSYDVRRVLELVFLHDGDKDYMVTERAASDFFRQFKEPYSTATFADFAAFIVAKTIADAFGI